VQGGHRGVSTKLMKEAMELLQTHEAENIERCEIIAAQRKGDINREVKIPRFRFTGTSIAILFTNFC
jgi:hypothetical protein